MTPYRASLITLLLLLGVALEISCLPPLSPCGWQCNTKDDCRWGGGGPFECIEGLCQNATNCSLPPRVPETSPNEKAPDAATTEQPTETKTPDEPTEPFGESVTSEPTCAQHSFDFQCANQVSEIALTFRAAGVSLYGAMPGIQIQVQRANTWQALGTPFFLDSRTRFYSIKVNNTSEISAIALELVNPEKRTSPSFPKATISGLRYGKVWVSRVAQGNNLSIVDDPTQTICLGEVSLSSKSPFLTVTTPQKTWSPAPICALPALPNLDKANYTSDKVFKGENIPQKTQSALSITLHRLGVFRYSVSSISMTSPSQTDWHFAAWLNASLDIEVAAFTKNKLSKRVNLAQGADFLKDNNGVHLLETKAYHAPRAAAIGIDRDGYLHVVGHMHESPNTDKELLKAKTTQGDGLLRLHGIPWKYWRSKTPIDWNILETKNELPAFSAVTIPTESIPGCGISYPAFHRDREGRLYITFQQRVRTTAGNEYPALGLARYQEDAKSGERRWMSLGKQVPSGVNEACGSVPGFTYSDTALFYLPTAGKDQAYQAAMFFDVANTAHIAWGYTEKRSFKDLQQSQFCQDRDTPQNAKDFRNCVTEAATYPHQTSLLSRATHSMYLRFSLDNKNPLGQPLLMKLSKQGAVSYNSIDDVSDSDEIARSDATSDAPAWPVFGVGIDAEGMPAVSLNMYGYTSKTIANARIAWRYQQKGEGFWGGEYRNNAISPFFVNMKYLVVDRNGETQPNNTLQRHTLTSDPCGTLFSSGQSAIFLSRKNGGHTDESWVGFHFGDLTSTAPPAGLSKTDILSIQPHWMQQRGRILLSALHQEPTLESPLPTPPGEKKERLFVLKFYEVTGFNEDCLVREMVWQK